MENQRNSGSLSKKKKKKKNTFKGAILPQFHWES